MYEKLKQAVCQANIELNEHNLVHYSFGNVCGIDRSNGIVAIKPSGVAYDQLTTEKIVLVDLDGNIIDSSLKPSSHLELYRNFETIGGICHTHSTNATMWAQACREIPCFGTTHADYFYGPVPVTNVMTNDEIKSDYELNTGKVIVRRFADLDSSQMPAVLVTNHGPFTWGKNPAAAVEAAVVLEKIAKAALGTALIKPNQTEISKILLDKHYLRKHGKDAYYDQEQG